MKGLDIDGFVSALASDYQKSRLERMAERFGLRNWTPLWHQSGHEHLKGMIDHGFEIMITGVSAEVDEEWLGRVLTPASFEVLSNLAATHRFHVEGEGGEYETLVLGGPHHNGRLSVGNRALGRRSGALRDSTERPRASATHSSTISPATPTWFIGSNMDSNSSAENAAEMAGVRLHTSINSSPLARL